MTATPAGCAALIGALLAAGGPVAILALPPRGNHSMATRARIAFVADEAAPARRALRQLEARYAHVPPHEPSR